jgi:outer membrane protein OmpA-like peptidoglycan-associated protein
MAKMLLCFLSFCFLFTGFSQNLVGNTGFEERNICVEYGVKCAPEAWFFLPRYARMAPVEADSNHYELLLMGDPNRPVTVGNFIYTKLFCPLVAGEKYNVKFRLHTFGHEFDYLDFWMGPTEPWRGRYSFSSIKPSFTVLPDSVKGNELKKWREVSYTFTAKGDEKFFLLGNISQKPLERGRKKAKRKAAIEYGVDDISIFALDPSIPKCAEYEAIKDQVYRNDYRHPGRWVDEIEIDSSLITQPKKDTTIIIDTPLFKAPPRTDTLIIPDVLFKFDKSDLNQKFISRLDSFVTAIKARTYSKLLVAGHTDNYGTDEYNLKLSQDRANTIRNYLLDKLNINGKLIDAKGYGESQPRNTNATAAGRQLNRRVEIIIYYE